MIEERISNEKFWKSKEEEEKKRKDLLNKFLKNPSRERLIELVKHMWTVGLRNRIWFVDNRILNKVNINFFAQRVKTLLNSGDVNIDIPGFDRGKTELLFINNPERFPIMNKRSVSTLEKLGFIIKNYDDFCRAVNSIFTEKMVVEKKRIENMFKIRLSKYNFIDTILYLASKGDEGKDTGIDSGRLKKFLDCEVPSLVAETIQIEITMDVMNELKRVSALAEAVYGKRPSINEVLYNSLKVYKRTLLQEIS